MKTTIQFLLLFFSFTGNTQIINIPDANFKSRLIDMGYDTNNDGEIQVSEADPVTILVLGPPYNITSIEGIKDFNNLTALSISNQPVTTLDFVEMDSLLFLEATGCTSLVNFQGHYTGLVNVNLSNCTNLTDVNCSGSYINDLNLQGCTSLINLDCSYNHISVLDLAGLNNLVNIRCNNNSIHALDVTGKTALYSLICDNNWISYLAVNDLPNLYELRCRYSHMLSLNLSNLPSLVYLECQNNSLWTLNLTNLPSLIFINCNSNFLSSIDVSGCPGLLHLACNDNYNLTEIDLSANTSLITFYGLENSWESINVKNGKHENVYIDSNTTSYICADEIDVIPISDFYSNAIVNHYCTSSPVGSFNTITGSVKLDINNNGCDENDPVLKNFPMKITGAASNAYMTFTDINGNYIFYAREGSYIVTPIIDSPTYFNVYPVNNQHVFNTLGNTVTYNFCLSPNGYFNDLTTFIIPIVSARPGADAKYKVVVYNSGSSLQSGTLNLTFDDSVLDYLQASSEPIITENQLSWTFEGLMPFQSIEKDVVFSINSDQSVPPVNINDVLQFTATAISSQGESTPQDNFYNLEDIVSGSILNNTKHVNKSNINNNDFFKYIYYTIRFDNINDMDATNLIIKDVLSSNLNFQSLRPVISSHSFRANVTGWLPWSEFIFENINLPPKTENDSQNQGYITFKIIPTIYTPGDFAENTAQVYLEPSSPVVTNTVTTTFNILGINNYDFTKKINIYPNPVEELLNIKSSEGFAITEVNIYSLLGQLIMTSTNETNTAVTVNVAALETGTYIIEIQSDKEKYTQKFIKL